MLVTHTCSHEPVYAHLSSWQWRKALRFIARVGGRREKRWRTQLYEITLQFRQMFLKLRPQLYTAGIKEKDWTQFHWCYSLFPIPSLWTLKFGMTESNPAAISPSLSPSLSLFQHYHNRTEQNRQLPPPVPALAYFLTIIFQKESGTPPPPKVLLEKY